MAGAGSRSPFGGFLVFVGLRLLSTRVLGRRTATRVKRGLKFISAARSGKPITPKRLLPSLHRGVKPLNAFGDQDNGAAPLFLIEVGKDALVVTIPTRMPRFCRSRTPHVQRTVGRETGG